MATIDQNPEHLNALAKEVSRVSGLDVTCTRDCEVLGDELRAFDGRFAVSTSTLRRFFGLIPKKGKYSTNTLNTLARYVGYASFRAWSQRQQSEGPIPNDQEHSFGPIAESAREKSPRMWSNQEAQAQVERFVKRFGDPKDFQLTTREFRRLKEAVFTIYERGTMDMGLWLKGTENPHLVRFIVEQFPPLDFLASFGQTMVDSYAEQATSPGEIVFAQSLRAAGLVAQDAPWNRVLGAFPRIHQLNPGVHPLVQSRQLGIAMLAQREGHGLDQGKCLPLTLPWKAFSTSVSSGLAGPIKAATSHSIWQIGPFLAVNITLSVRSVKTSRNFSLHKIGTIETQIWTPF